ncbi:MAG TPA: vitamin K epoxide reductase family protein, partial [Polyangia bacterium]
MRRRWIARLAALGLVDAAAMSLLQTGSIRRLPDLPLRGFDSQRVVSSPAAYVLGVPDATLGAAQYAGTLVLASLVDTPRLRRRGWWPLLLGAVV